jgi:hypothetical protein
MVRSLIPILVLLLASCAATGPVASEDLTQSIDPAAMQILKRATTQVGALRQFSVKTQITLEDVLESGHIADSDVSTEVTIKRPNMIRCSRRGDLIDQDFFYDGKNLTLYNPADRAYATVVAPKTIEGVIHYTVDTLGLTVPAADLIYKNAYPLLMQHVTHAELVGKAVIGGVTCDHLLFVCPEVDFQVWVADSGLRLPMKYVVTDTATPERLSITTVMSEWNVDPGVTDDLFAFRPPAGTQKIDFLPLTTTGGSNR